MKHLDFSWDQLQSECIDIALATYGAFNYETLKAMDFKMYNRFYNNLAKKIKEINNAS
jgi:hypothetical protein